MITKQPIQTSAGFDPNERRVKNSWFVYVERFNRELPVTSMQLLDNEKDTSSAKGIQVWGFAKDKQRMVEFDTAWGDTLRQERTEDGNV